MKRFFLLLFIAGSIAGYPQKNNTSKKRSERPKIIRDSATAISLIKMRDSLISVTHSLDENKIQENISPNMDGILQLQKEQKAKQKKAAMIRIGIGVALLALLVVGLRRKKK